MQSEGHLLCRTAAGSCRAEAAVLALGRWRRAARLLRPPRPCRRPIQRRLAWRRAGRACAQRLLGLGAAASQGIQVAGQGMTELPPKQLLRCRAKPAAWLRVRRARRKGRLHQGAVRLLRGGGAVRGADVAVAALQQRRLRLLRKQLLLRVHLRLVIFLAGRP